MQQGVLRLQGTRCRGAFATLMHRSSLGEASQEALVLLLPRRLLLLHTLHALAVGGGNVLGQRVRGKARGQRSDLKRSLSRQGRGQHNPLPSASKLLCPLGHACSRRHVKQQDSALQG